MSSSLDSLVLHSFEAVQGKLHMPGALYEEGSETEHPAGS